jgi:hypothetical protein
MAVCPHCQFADPDPSGVCSRCGGVLLPPSTTALPDPMVEPIHPPSVPPPDGLPLSARLALTVPFGGTSSGAVAEEPPRGGDATPAPATLIDLPPAEPQTDETVSNGTNPSQPGLTGHPMNDSALQSPPMTVPATDRADSAPAPIPAATALRPKLVVLRGLRIDVEYPVYEGRNTVGRFADKPVDIDLMNQESVEQIWCSRQHAVVTCEAGVVAVEDLNSLNGTWVNGVRIHPGQRRPLKPGDVLQIGTVQMKLVLA